MRYKILMITAVVIVVIAFIWMAQVTLPSGIRIIVSGAAGFIGGAVISYIKYDK